MEEKQLTPAPIDNKNVMTNFTEVFHNGDYITRKGTNGRIFEYFIVEDCLCVVSYMLGRNDFLVYPVILNHPSEAGKIYQYLDKCIGHIYHDNVAEELIVKKEGNCTYALYHIEL